MPKKIFPSFIIRFLPVMAILYLFAGLTLSEENISQPEILWRPEGILVNDTPGGSAQKNPKVISSGTSYIAVWEDGRSGFFNIYAQKIGEGADLEWGKDALAVCQAPMNQSLPEIVSDGEDGAIVIWEDYRSGHADIYAQKISGLGTVEWKKDGIPICEAPNAQLRPLAISDGYGGAIITWYDYRGELAEDIYAQRIDNTGRVLWQKDGVPISAEKGTQWYPGIAPDGTGGAVIVWTDFRSGSTSDVYAQRISSSGKIMWEKDGIPVASIAENQLNPDIAYAGAGEVIIAWEDYRAGNFDIYSQKIKITSETVWQKNGIQVGSSVFNEEEPHIVADQAGGAIVVWKERRINGSNILSQKIDKDGLASWGETPKMICKEDGQKSRISISPADRGGALISWEDTRAGNSDIYIQKLSSTGITLWKVGGSPVARISDDQENPQILASGQNGAFVVWQDKRYGNYDIYAQKLESDSSESWIPNGIIVNASIGSVAQKGPVLGRDGDGNYIITWEDGRSGYTDIYAQKLDESGKLLFEQNGVPVCTAEGAQRNPRMLIDGADIFIVWEDFRSSYPQIYIQKLDQDGRPLFESNGLPVSRIELSQVNPQLISDGKKGAIVIFEEQLLGERRYDIVAQRIDASGKLLWGKSGIGVCSELADQQDGKAVPDGMGGTIVAWTDYRSGLQNSDVYAQRINSSGEALWAAGGIKVCGAPDVQKEPAISFSRAEVLASESENGAIIVWTDKGGGGYDIYGQRINLAGKTLWKEDGIPICEIEGTQKDPKIVENGAGGAIVVFEDYRFGNWDIYCQKINKKGDLLWPAPGIPITKAPGTQYSPDIAPSNSGGAIITWEDYRSSLGYMIYAQKIEGDGKISWQQNGISICNLPGGQRNPKIIGNGGGGAVISWEDYRSGGYGIYAQRIRVIKLQ